MAQWAAVGLGGLAVAVLTVDYGHLPYLALVLALSFAGYGLIKKRLGLPAAQALFIESAVLALPALGYLGWLAWRAGIDLRADLGRAHPAAGGGGRGHRDSVAASSPGRRTGCR